jgi:predicted kinase
MANRVLEQPAIIAVTGIQAAGKSTIARLLAQRFARGVHIEADQLQHMIVSGSEGVQEPGDPQGEAQAQYLLRLKHMCLLGRSFFEAGFTVVLDDIMLGDSWHYVQEQLQGLPYALVVLAPRVEVVAQVRDRQRSKRPLGEAWAVYLDRAFRETMTGVGYWIDSSNQTPEETVDAILQRLYPTPYAEVNSLLHMLLEDMQAILGERLVGLYLRGSLAQGDFDLASSDVDFLAVTDTDLPEAQLDRLRQMHAAIASSGHPFAQRLEGSYIPREAIRRYDPSSTARHPTIGTDWPFKLDVHGSDWVFQRAIVQERGVAVWGPPPHTLIDPISPQDLRAAVCDQLGLWWRSRLDDPDWMRPRDYQAYTVLTMCRVFYTLEHGALCSKPQAAAWAEVVYPQWKPIIERSLAWRSDHAPDDVTETMAFLREALARAEALCRQAGC